MAKAGISVANDNRMKVDTFGSETSEKRICDIP